MQTAQYSGRAATAADLDRRLAARVNASEPAHIDLKRVDYIGHDALLYLVALFHGRARQSFATTVSLPRTATAVDFLRAWNFPGALTEVTNRRSQRRVSAAERP